MMAILDDIQNLALYGKEVFIDLPGVQGYVTSLVFGTIHFSNGGKIGLEELGNRFGDTIKIVNSGSHYKVILKN